MRLDWKMLLLILVLITIFAWPVPSQVLSVGDKFSTEKVQRETDIIKFKKELTETLISVSQESASKAKKSIHEFMSMNKTRFKPYHFIIDLDEQGPEYILYLTVFYDSFKFESFNIIHQPSKNLMGLNISEEFKKENMKK